MTLYIDQGNTRTKLWLVAGEAITASFSHAAESSADAWLAPYIDYIDDVVVASVRAPDVVAAYISLLGLGQVDVRYVSYSEEQLPSHYEQVQQLGIDRWLVTLAAKRIRKDKRPVLVVDAGTAITIDVLSAQGEHLGGYILPGLGLQVGALARHTHRVQVPDPLWRHINIGRKTQDCVSNGILASVVSLIEHAIAHLEGTEGVSASLYLTGGDAGHLWSHLPRATHIKELVLLGLMAAAERPLIAGVSCEG